MYGSRGRHREDGREQGEGEAAGRPIPRTSLEQIMIILIILIPLLLLLLLILLLIIIVIIIIIIGWTILRTSLEHRASSSGADRTPFEKKSHHVPKLQLYD